MLRGTISMRERLLECFALASHHIRVILEMCSREPGPGVFQHHSNILKANGKSPKTSQQHQSQSQSLQLLSSDSHLISSEDERNTYNDNSLPTPGGRLKFFKDGKFILELSHRKDGERTTWFPVPKKTFWPPTTIMSNHQESSISLSGQYFYKLCIL